MPDGTRRDHQEEVSEQGDGDSDRADDEVLPGRLERAVMSVEVNQGGARQRRRLDSDPHQPDVPRRDHEGHRTEKDQEAADERGLGSVREEETLLDVRPRLATLALEVADAVRRRHQEQGAGDAQEEHLQRIEGQPAAQERQRAQGPRRRGQPRVRDRRRHEQDPAKGIASQEERQPAGDERGQDDGQDHEVQCSPRVLSPSAVIVDPCRYGRIRD